MVGLLVALVLIVALPLLVVSQWCRSDLAKQAQSALTQADLHGRPHEDAQS